MTKHGVTEKLENTKLISILYFLFSVHLKVSQMLSRKATSQVNSIIWDNILKFVYVVLDLCCCLTILQVPFLRQENLFSIFELLIKPRMECKQILLEKDFESITEVCSVVL